MMEQSEREEIQEELEMLEILLYAYNSSPKLMSSPGASEYIDSILDRINELNRKLNNAPS